MEMKKDIKMEQAAIMLQAMKNLQKKQEAELAKRSLAKTFQTIKEQKKK